MPPKRPRLKTFDYLGEYRYCLTFCCADRHHAFLDAAIVDSALAQILRAAGEHDFAIVAYCFIPDHVHLLVEGTAPDSDMRHFVKQGKQYSGFHYKQRCGRTLWQPSYFDHVLRDEDDTWSVARYLVDNPLAAGLARNPNDYPFLGSCVVTKQELIFAASCAKPWSRG